MSRPSLPRPQRSVLADEVYEILREGLMSQRIAPGSRLNLDKLARELHVSNTPVRQALARLEADGLVAKEPYRGFTASQLLDSRTIAELYDYRLLIEPPTAARAARHQHAAAVAELESLCDGNEITRLITTAPDDDDLAQRDVDFHCSIARQAGNGVVVNNLAQTLLHMRRYTVYGLHGAGEQAWLEHRAIMAAIAAGDPEAASTAMREHLVCGLDRMKTALR
ncbi:GntR family transcriptional regulator [Streptomyces sp. NBC_00154]|uniref:GntR family transcriptional regulator n=1 Tax=Streptomyces sp. NBC_00154 TaxID=2975670 RepID=UPI0022551784|nr:GntR family transcriptional regulator [Streptomyces sp. NBC_00154]MCX5317019.1 GntR family transcriptional regulator [Streptomyces sp. NBC_00154]